MRYKEGEKVLFKFHSGITDAEDFKVGDVVTQMDKGLPDWKTPGEFYYIVKSEFGWVVITHLKPHGPNPNHILRHIHQQQPNVNQVF